MYRRVRMRHRRIKKRCRDIKPHYDKENEGNRKHTQPKRINVGRTNKKKEERVSLGPDIKICALYPKKLIHGQ